MRKSFEDQETEELLRLRQAGTLTDEAQGILGEVLAQRVDAVPPAVPAGETAASVGFSMEEENAQSRWIKRTRAYFSWFPILGLPVLQVRGLIWIVLAMFTFRVLAAPTVRGIFAWRLERRQRNFVLTLVYLTYPVLLVIYVAIIRVIFA